MSPLPLKIQLEGEIWMPHFCKSWVCNSTIIATVKRKLRQLKRLVGLKCLTAHQPVCANCKKKKKVIFTLGRIRKKFTIKQ